MNEATRPRFRRAQSPQTPTPKEIVWGRYGTCLFAVKKEISKIIVHFTREDRPKDFSTPRQFLHDAAREANVDS